MYQPRAGRRAAPAATSAAIDPLDAPPPHRATEPSWLDDPPPEAETRLAAATELKPLVTASATESLVIEQRPPLAQRSRTSVAPLSQVAGGPSWLDEAGGAATHSALQEKAPTVESPATNGDEWSMVRDRSSRPRVTMTQSAAPAPSSSPAAGSVDSPQAAVSVRTEPTAPAATVTPIPQTSPPAYVKVPTTATATAASAVAPPNATKPPASQSVQPLMGVDAILQHAPMSAPSQAITSVVAYDDERTVVAELELELRNVEANLESCHANVVQLENGTHGEASGLAALEAQIAFMKKQCDAADASRENYAKSVEARLTSLKERVNTQVAAAAAQIQQRCDENFTRESKDMETLRTAIEGSVESLGHQLDEEMSSLVVLSDISVTGSDAASSSKKPTVDDFALQKLAALVRVFVADEQSQMKHRARDVLQEEARLATNAAAVERAERLEQDRRVRMKTIADHAVERRRKFELFRQRAREDRQEAADRLFGSLKVRMEAFAKDAQQRSTKLLAEHRLKVEQDDLRVRRDADQQLDRMLARQRAEAIGFEQSCSQAEADLQVRLRSVLEHQQRMQSAEKESATRILSEAQATVGCKDTTFGVDGAFEGAGWSRSGLAAELFRDVHDLHKSVGFVLDDAKIALCGGESGAMKSEVRRLIAERESVLKELRRHMDSQRESLRHDWLRLESLLTSLASKADAFEKSVRQGRSSLTTHQARLDAVRMAWESEGRKTLSAAFGEVSQSHGGGLPLSTEAILNQVVFELSVRAQQLAKVSRKNAAARNGLWNSVAAHEEAMTLKQGEVGRATMKVVESFEAIAETTARLESKQQWMMRESSDLAGAKAQLVQEQSEFQRAVDVAREVAERLQRASAEAQQPQHVPQAHSYRQQQQPGARVSGGDVSYHPNASLRREKGSMVPQGDTRHHLTQPSATDEYSKYKSYYQQQPSNAGRAATMGFSAFDVSQPSGVLHTSFSQGGEGLRGGGGSHRPNGANHTLSSFQSLVPVDEDSSHEEAPGYPVRGGHSKHPDGNYGAYLSIRSSHPRLSATDGDAVMSAAQRHEFPGMLNRDAFGGGALTLGITDDGEVRIRGSSTESSSNAAAVETYRRLGVLGDAVGTGSSGASQRSHSEGVMQAAAPTVDRGAGRYSLPTPTTASSESGRGVTIDQ